MGITRDEPLAQQIINLLFCKVFDETSKGPNELVDFRAGAGEKASAVKDRILDLFARVKTRYADVFEPNDSIELDDDGRGGVFCDNSLFPPDKWNPILASKVKLGKFNVVLTNPPFGTKIPVKGADVLAQYTLGHREQLDKPTGKYKWTTKLHDKQPPQLLFIERCLELLKPGGRMGIVLPESVLGMPTYTHIVQFLRERVRIVGVVSMPEDLFQPHTHAKTAVLFIKNVKPDPGDSIFMSVVEWCGHDSRGNPTVRINADGKEELLDDVPKVAQAFNELIKDFR